VKTGEGAVISQAVKDGRDDDGPQHLVEPEVMANHTGAVGHPEEEAGGSPGVIEGDDAAQPSQDPGGDESKEGDIQVGDKGDLFAPEIDGGGEAPPDEPPVGGHPVPHHEKGEGVFKKLVRAVEGQKYEMGENETPGEGPKGGVNDPAGVQANLFCAPVRQLARCKNGDDDQPREDGVPHDTHSMRAADTRLAVPWDRIGARSVPVFALSDANRRPGKNTTILAGSRSAAT